MGGFEERPGRFWLLSPDYCCGKPDTPYAWGYPVRPDRSCVEATFQMPDWEIMGINGYLAWCCPQACMPNPLVEGVCSEAYSIGYGCYGEYPDLVLPTGCTVAEPYASGLCCEPGVDGNIGPGSFALDLAEYCTEPPTQPGCGDYKVRCGDECVDVRANAAHCGACDSPCDVGFVCVDGSCACPEGRMNCGGECVNVSSEHDHCGTCWYECETLQICSRGECIAPP